MKLLEKESLTQRHGAHGGGRGEAFSGSAVSLSLTDFPLPAPSGGDEQTQVKTPEKAAPCLSPKGASCAAPAAERRRLPSTERSVRPLSFCFSFFSGKEREEKGGRLIEMMWLPNQTFDLIVSSSSEARGWLDTAPDGNSTSSYMRLRTDSNGYASNFYIGYGIPGNTEIVMSAYSGSRSLGAVSNLVLKYNSDFTLEDLETNSNAILTFDVHIPDGDNIYTSGPVAAPGRDFAPNPLIDNFTTNTKSEAVRQIQEMLNMVCPRKASTAFGIGVPRYNIISENGYFDINTVNALDYLANKFVKVTNSFCLNSSALSNNPQYRTEVLVKKYKKITNYTTNTYATIDFQTLYGKEKYLLGNRDLLHPILTWDLHPDADTNAKGRDGLVEIYSNIVMNFIGQMLNAGLPYVNENTTWKKFEDHTSDGNPGVAYCNGGIDTVQQFIGKIRNFTPYPVDNWIVYSNNVNNVTNKGYPTGLHNDSVFNPIDPRDWSGVDCRGFVQRTCKTARYSTGNAIIDDEIIPDLGVTNIVQNIGTLGQRWVNSLTTYRKNRNTPQYDNDKYANTYFIANTEDYTRKYSKWIHRGDIIANNDHVVIVYDNPDTNYSISFNIINAYGSTPSTINGVRQYSRKAMIFPFSVWHFNSDFRNESFDNIKVNATGTTNTNHYDFRYGRFVLWQD